MNKKIAIIGAGLSGLATIKELVEAGHDVVCFEKGNDIGGVFSDTGTYDSVELTVSNYFMAYSDFMPYEDNIRIWTRGEYKAYLDRYVDHFDLRKYIRFGYELEKTHKVESGGWQLTFKDNEASIHTEYAPRIVICSGQFQQANIPMIPGLDTFKGSVVHSSLYINAAKLKSFHGKRVLCFGMGESAADIVTEIASVAAATTLSLRRHHVFSSRMTGGKFPIDVRQSRYWHSIPAKKKAESVRSIWRKVKSMTDQESERLLAEHIIAAPDEPGSVVTKTERIFEAQAHGMNVDIGGVQEIKGAKVIFNSGREEEFDAILFCTGFKFNLPFLDEKYQFNDIRECYLQTYHPQLREDLVFIGYARPQQGGVPLIAELSARYYALVCSGKRELPENLKTLAEQDADMWRKEFYETPNVFGLVNGFRYNEKLATLIGCKPPMPFFLTSPKKFLVYWQHHVWPSQYRLVGPGAQQSARDNWLKAPLFYNVKGNVFLRSAKLALMITYWKIKSKLVKDDKKKWRPI